MSLLVQMIRSFDMFSVNPTWYVRRNRKSTSTSGIFFTCLMIGYLVWIFIYLSNDLINRVNPKVTGTLLSGVALSDKFELHPDSFAYIFGMQNGDTGEFYIDQTIYTVQGELTYQNGSTTTFPLVSCNPADVNRSIPYKGDLLCFDKNRYDIYLSGINSLAILTFATCKNSTENNNHCQSQAVLDSIYTRNDQLYFFFPVSSVQPANYSVPIIRNWNYQNFFLESSLTKRLSMMTKKLTLRTDSGFITSEESIITQTAHEIFFCDIGARVQTHFFSVEIFTNGDVEYISRSFQKLQEFFAQITGITHAIFVVIALLVIPFTRMKMYQYLGLEVFNLQLKNKDEAQKKKKIRRDARMPRETILIHNTNITKENPDLSASRIRYQDESQQKEFLTVENQGPKVFVFDEKMRLPTKPMGSVVTEILQSPTAERENAKPQMIVVPERKRCTCARRNKKSPRTLSFSYCEWIASFCKKTPKMLLADKIKQEICKRTDIETVISKFMEIELLKRLLLSEEQQVLFDNLCRPKLKLTYKFEQGKGIVYDYKLDDLLVNYNGQKSFADEAYKALRSKIGKNGIDIELMKRYEKKQKRKREENANTKILESWNIL